MLHWYATSSNLVLNSWLPYTLWKSKTRYLKRSLLRVRLYQRPSTFSKQGPRFNCQKACGPHMYGFNIFILFYQNSVTVNWILNRLIYNKFAGHREWFGGPRVEDRCSKWTLITASWTSYYNKHVRKNKHCLHLSKSFSNYTMRRRIRNSKIWKDVISSIV
jgi:hypothetical protein